MIWWVFSLPLGLQILAILPVLALTYLFSSSLLRIGVRLFLVAFHGCQRLSDDIVTTTTSAATRASRVTLGLGYIGARKTLRPVHVRFERVERWVDLRLVVPAGDGIAEAMEVLGLAGDFNRTDLDGRYKHVIQLVHPDKGGTEGLAKKVNGAKALLMVAKGWR